MTPLKRLLDTAPDEAAIRAGWDAIAARLPERAHRRTLARRLVLAGAAAAAAIAVVAVAWSPDTRPAPGPLALADGRPMPSELTTDTLLSDGSQIAIPRGQLEVLESDGHAIRWLLATGTARFAIRPGGPRRWTVDAGVAQIEVIGTVFTVARSIRGVDVAVERGVVVVRGERVPGLVRRLQAGQTFHVPAGITARAVDPAPSPPPSPSAPEPVPNLSASLAVPAPTARSPSPRAPAPRSPSSKPSPASRPSSLDTAGALPSSPARPSEPPPPPIASLTAPAPISEAILARADDLRRRGDLAGAAAVLDQISNAPGDPLRAIARFTRARILIDLGRRADAAQDLRRAIAVGLPPALEARARTRLAELSDPGASR